MCIGGFPRSQRWVKTVSARHLFGRRCRKLWQGVRKLDREGKEGNRKCVSKASYHWATGPQSSWETLGDRVEHSLVEVSCNGPESEYFQLSGSMISVTSTQLCL